MLRGFSSLLLAGAMLVSPAVAFAQAEKAVCPAVPAALPADLVAFTSRTAVAAAAAPGRIDAAIVTPGAAVDAALKPSGDVRFAFPPERPGKPESFSGLLAFDVAEAGTYRVALGARAWIDVLADGKAVTSTAHGHGPECSGIRKIVNFPLAKGRHVLQIAGSPTQALSVLIVKAP